MAEDQGDVDFHRLDCKKPRIQPSTLHTKGQSPKAIVLQNAYMTILFDQGNGLSKEVWVGQEWKPKMWSRGHQFFCQ